MTQPVTHLDDARALLASGDLAAAEAACRQALDRDGERPEPLFLLGLTLTRAGRFAAAAETLERALVLAPAQPRLHNALGAALAGQGRTDAAIAQFRAALAQEGGADIAAHNLARLLDRQGQHDEAAGLLDAVVTRTPTNAAAWADLGAVHYHARRHGPAEAALTRALDLAPTPAVSRHLAGLYRVQGRTGAARALAARSGDPLARFLADTTVPAILDTAAQAETLERDYLAALDTAPALRLDDPLAAFATLGHFHFAYWDRPVGRLNRATAASYRRLCPSLTEDCPPGAGPRPRRARPRVVFVSAHWHDHTISRLFAGLVTGLASRFEVIAALAPGRRDQSTRALAARVPVLALAARLADARRQLAELAADVIVYPDLGMDPFTYFLAHARLAPRQVTTWGHPVSPGLDSIDAFIGARGLDDGAARADHGEALVETPEPAFVFSRPSIPKRRREDYGLPEAGRLYVCPQSLFKFHPDFDRLIGAILRADRQGRLVLLGGTVAARRQALGARFRRTLPELGGRIHMLAPLSRPDFLGLLGTADMMLDIPSFSGGNTTLEALAAGLPVVTWPRPTLRGGLSAALLRLAGLEQGIATSAEDYVARALGRDGAPDRAAIAAQATILFDRSEAIGDFATALEQVLEHKRADDTGA